MDHDDSSFLKERHVSRVFRRQCRKLEYRWNLHTPHLQLVRKHGDVFTSNEVWRSQCFCYFGPDKTNFAGLSVDHLIHCPSI